MPFQACNNHLPQVLLKSSSAFCGMIMDYSPIHRILHLSLRGRTLLERFYPHGEFAPVQEGFYYHNVAAWIQHRCVLVSHLVRCEWHKSLTITGSPRKSKFWPCEKFKIPSYPPSRRGLRYEVRQWHVLLLLHIFCWQSPAGAVAVTLPFPQLRSFLKCYANERIRITVRHRKFQKVLH